MTSTTRGVHTVHLLGRRSDVVAVVREDDDITRMNVGDVDVDVERLELADGHVVLLGEVVENVAGLNDIGANAVAHGVGAERRVDDLAGEDQVVVGDLWIAGLEGCQGDVERGGDGGEGVAGLDGVGRSHTQHAGVRNHWGGLDARGVVRGDAVGGNAEDLVRLDVVWVIDAVDLGDVADARVVLLGDGAEGITGLDGVVCEGGRAAHGAWSC